MSDTSTTKAKQATHEAEIDNSNRSTTPQSDKFLDYIMSGWAPSDDTLPAVRESAAYAAGRRTRLGAQFVGKRLVIAAGAMKQRSNDTFYQYRAHSAFSHLTGWGSDSEPGAVLVMDPIAADEGRGSAETHEATLYFRERAGRDSEEFFANPEIGEFWIGARPSLEQVAADLGLRTANLDQFEASDADVTLEHEEFARATFQQLFTTGFFHADPHPGNIFVTPTTTPDASASWSLTYIDFGMMGEITASLRDGLRRFIFAVVARDGRGLVAAIQGLDSRLHLQILSLGASTGQLYWKLVKEARLSLVAALAAGFGSIISEVGAVMMVGGNIKGQTRVMTTAIVLQTRQGEFGNAIVLGVILLSLALGINWLFTWVQQRQKA